MNIIQAIIAAATQSNDQASQPQTQDAEVLSLPEDALDNVGGGSGGTNLL